MLRWKTITLTLAACTALAGPFGGVAEAHETRRGRYEVVRREPDWNWRRAERFERREHALREAALRLRFERECRR
jgi:hypothetical protein